MNMLPFDSWVEAIFKMPELSGILYSTITQTNVNSSIKISQFRVEIRDKTFRDKFYKANPNLDMSKLLVGTQHEDMSWLPNKLAYPSVPQFEKDFTSTSVGEWDGIPPDSIEILQIPEDSSLPDISYNVYIGMHRPFTGSPTITTTDTFNSAEFNIMGLAASTPQDFITEIDPTKTKISRIGKPVQSDEYNIETLAKNLFIRDSSLSRKHGNLKKYNVVEWAPNIKFIQIGKGVSKNDTIMILNHKFDTPSNISPNGTLFNTILYIPVGTKIDSYLAEEKIKRGIIKNKLVELLNQRNP